MKDELIQILHPQSGKTNKRISAEKYWFIKKNLLAILAKEEFTHTVYYSCDFYSGNRIYNLMFKK